MPDPSLDELLLQNPNAPTNDHFALQFARDLLPPAEERDDDFSLSFDFAEGPAEFRALDNEGTDWCGEPTRGLLDAVMASDLLSDQARNTIGDMMEDAAPSLERSKTIGHFNFRWTETSSNLRDNTSEANIDATGLILNDCWDRFVVDFREPKAALIGGQRMVDVDVYYDGGLHGSTSSHTNRIFLNSHTVVNDDCRRKTTSAHELFHRVEYSYGYVTGTAGQRWWVEALGSWSQEYYAPEVDDYISRVNTGLGSPGNNLLGRSYDACHYWKYLGEQVSARSAVGSETEAIREVLDEYAGNGRDAKAACDTVTTARLSRPFDRFFQDWTKANYLKDLTSPSAKYDYAEDETTTNSCGRNYGPYRVVAPVSDHKITSNQTTWSSGVQAIGTYGSRYHHFDIEPGVTEFEVRFEGNLDGGSGDYSVHVALIKDDRWKRILNSTNTTEVARHVEFDAGTYDRCVVVVNGLAAGGQYELGLNACVTGVWKDSFNFVWTLVQAGDDVSGTVTTSSCGEYAVTGTVTGNELALNASGNCCDFSYRGTVDDCASVDGDWTSECGGSGTFRMNKVDASDTDLVLDEDEEFAEDPTNMGTS